MATDHYSDRDLRDIVDALIVVAEDLRDRPRARRINPPIRKTKRAMGRFFRLQMEYFIRHGLPMLHGAYSEAAHVPSLPTVDMALHVIDRFTNKPFEQVFNRQLLTSFLGGASIASMETAVGISWTLKSPDVLKYLQTRSASIMGADINETTKTALRELLTRGYAENWTFSKVQKEIRALGSQFTRDRAEVIAVNEMGNAFSAGALEFDRSIAANGALVQKAWMLADNPCPICEANAGAGWIGLEDSFASGHMAPTAHPRCRCSLTSRVVKPS